MINSAAANLVVAQTC